VNIRVGKTEDNFRTEPSGRLSFFVISCHKCAVLVFYLAHNKILLLLWITAVNTVKLTVSVFRNKAEQNAARLGDKLDG